LSYDVSLKIIFSIVISPFVTSISYSAVIEETYLWLYLMVLDMGRSEQVYVPPWFFETVRNVYPQKKQG